MVIDVPTNFTAQTLPYPLLKSSLTAHFYILILIFHPLDIYFRPQILLQIYSIKFPETEGAYFGFSVIFPFHALRLNGKKVCDWGHSGKNIEL